MQEATKRSHLASQTFSDRLDGVALNRWLGIHTFWVVTYTMSLVSINLGGAFIDFFDLGIGTVLVGGTAHLLEQLRAPG
jgi:ferrous iron transport protein B